jgi:hypothetical protein
LCGGRPAVPSFTTVHGIHTHAACVRVQCSLRNSIPIQFLFKKTLCTNPGIYMGRQISGRPHQDARAIDFRPGGSTHVPMVS